MGFRAKYALYVLLCGLTRGLHAQTSPGEVLYNGITLPHDWPPGRVATQQHQVPPYLVSPPSVINIDVGRQLFVDDFLIEETTLTRTFHKPVVRPNPVLTAGGGDTFWAIPFSDGVWFDPADKLYKLFYWGGGGNVVAFAYSSDGISWTKPSIPDAAVPNTNHVISTNGRDSATVWMDLEDTDPSRKFKAFLYSGGNRQSVYFSPDGIHWRQQPFTINSLSDRTTFFWNPFRRVWVESARSVAVLPQTPIRESRTARARYYAESRDLRQWYPRDPANTFWSGPDDNDPGYTDTTGPYPELYNLDAVAYESLFVGLFSWYYPKPGPDLVELGVGFSRDGFHWIRPTRGSRNSAFIAASDTDETWNGFNTQSAGGGFLVVGDELWFYFSGRNARHSNTATAMSTGLATMRRDGFSSLDAGASEGMILTRPVRFQGNRLFVNVSNPRGELRAEILDTSGQTIEPFTRANSIPVSIDSTRQEVRWTGATDLQSVAGQTVQFRFYLTSGQLYSFWIAPGPSGASLGFLAAGHEANAMPFDIVGNGTPAPGGVDGPMRFLGLPSGMLPAGSTQTNISIATAERSACRYSTMADQDFASMAALAPSPGGIIHSASVINLTAGATYKYFVRCQNSTQETNTTDYEIQFAVGNIELSGIILSSNTVIGTLPLSGNQVQLSAADPEKNVVVTLSSSNPEIASVPPRVVIPAASSLSNAFTINTAAVSVPTSVTIAAELNGVRRMVILVVNPPAVSALTLPDTIYGGRFVTGRVSLTSLAGPGGALVQLTASPAGIVTVPASVTIRPNNITSPYFPVENTEVKSNQTVTVSATYGGVTVSRDITVKPEPVVDSVPSRRSVQSEAVPRRKIGHPD